MRSAARDGRHHGGESPIKIVEPENSQFQYQNFQSRSRLDARLWLMCRLSLVRAMMGEIKGMGQVKGTGYLKFLIPSHAQLMI